MTATRSYIEKFGRPISFYVDFGSVFRVNLNNPDHEKLTQFEQAIAENTSRSLSKRLEVV